MNILHSWWCFCVSSVWLTGEQKPHGGRSHSRPEMFLSLVGRFLITAIIKLPSYCDILYAERTSVTTATIWPSRLLDILWHCFLNVAALLHCPVGPVLKCGSIVLLPVADISTGSILLLPFPNITHWSTAHVCLFQTWTCLPKHWHAHPHVHRHSGRQRGRMHFYFLSVWRAQRSWRDKLILFLFLEKGKKKKSKISHSCLSWHCALSLVVVRIIGLMQRVRTEHCLALYWITGAVIMQIGNSFEHTHTHAQVESIMCSRVIHTYIWS